MCCFSQYYDQLAAEEESLKMLKKQLSQLQSIRVDNEQKELLISKLKAQVKELTSYKESGIL